MRNSVNGYISRSSAMSNHDRCFDHRLIKQISTDALSSRKLNQITQIKRNVLSRNREAIYAESILPQAVRRDSFANIAYPWHKTASITISRCTLIFDRNLQTGSSRSSLIAAGNDGSDQLGPLINARSLAINKFARESAIRKYFGGGKGGGKWAHTAQTR